MALDRDKVLQNAQKLVEKKRYDKAIAEYQKLVAEDPKDVRTLLKIGDLHLKMEQYVEAITTYEGVGQFYSSQGFALKAIAVYKQIREIIHRHVPQFADRFGHVVPRLAEIYTQLGLTSDALATYDELATRLQRAGRDRDAIDVFRKVVEIEPSNPIPYLRLAEAYVRVKDVESAIQRFGAAAEILLRLGRRDDALKVVERLLQHRVDAKFARMAAEIYLDRGEQNDGMAALTKLQISFKENPKDLDTLALLARAFDELGQPAKAVEVQKEAARIARDTNKEAFRALIEGLLQRAPHDEAVKQLAAMRSVAAPSPSVADGPSTRSSIDVEISVDAVSVEEYAEAVASAEPFALQQPSQAQVPVDPAARARQIVAQAEALRRTKSYEHAASVLVAGIEELPDARELREKMSDLLIEAGDQAGAVQHMLAFAQHLATSGDVPGAARILDEVLLLEPGQPDAVHLLASLGYTLPGDTYAPVPAPEEYGYEPYAQEGAAGYADSDAPLPSYDLEEVGPEEAAGLGGHAAAFAAAQLDEPFATEAPLPSFPIEEDAAEFVLSLSSPSVGLGQPAGADAGQGPIDSASAVFDAPAFEDAPDESLGDAFAAAPPGAHASDAPSFDAPSFDAPFGAEAGYDAPAYDAPAYDAPSQGDYAEAAGGYDASASEGAASYGDTTADAPRFFVPAPPTVRGSDAPSQLDEDALDEVEFFASHAMYEEAFAILDEQLQRLPNHPLLLERRRELEALAAGAAESGARPMSRAEPESEEDRAFDIAASLDALDAIDQEAVSRATVDHDPRQISVESVFEQFKAGVAAHVSESDAATHYDLGVAYREMGLLQDAIAEFDLAARDPTRECVCHSMIGMIHLQLGNVDGAIDAFIRGLHAPQRTVEQELALTYEIANAFEMRHTLDQALYYFQRVARADPHYADPRGSVSERICRIETAHQRSARAVGAENLRDDFDAMFDNLIEGGKLP